MEILWISLAFILGLGTRQFGLPPLVDYSNTHPQGGAVFLHSPAVSSAGP